MIKARAEAFASKFSGPYNVIEFISGLLQNLIPFFYNFLKLSQKAGTFASDRRKKHKSFRLKKPKAFVQEMCCG